MVVAGVLLRSILCLSHRWQCNGGYFKQERLPVAAQPFSTIADWYCPNSFCTFPLYSNASPSISYWANLAAHLGIGHQSRKQHVHRGGGGGDENDHLCEDCC